MRVKVTDIHAGWPIGTVVELNDKDASALLKLKLVTPYIEEPPVKAAAANRTTKDTPEGMLIK